MIIKRAAWFQSVPAIFILFLEGAPLAYRHTMNETSAHHRRNTHRIEIIHRCTRHCVSRIPLAGSRADSLIGETSSCPFRFFFDWRERERERDSFHRRLQTDELVFSETPLRPGVELTAR